MNRAELAQRLQKHLDDGKVTKDELAELAGFGNTVGLEHVLAGRVTHKSYTKGYAVALLQLDGLLEVD